MNMNDQDITDACEGNPDLRSMLLRMERRLSDIESRITQAAIFPKGLCGCPALYGRGVCAETYPGEAAAHGSQCIMKSSPAAPQVAEGPISDIIRRFDAIMDRVRSNGRVPQSAALSCGVDSLTYGDFIALRNWAARTQNAEHDAGSLRVQMSHVCKELDSAREAERGAREGLARAISERDRACEALADLVADYDSGATSVFTKQLNSVDTARRVLANTPNDQSPPMPLAETKAVRAYLVTDRDGGVTAYADRGFAKSVADRYPGSVITDLVEATSPPPPASR